MDNHDQGATAVATPTTPLTPTAGELMTLATIAYSAAADIPAQLSNPAYATRGAYKCVWMGTSTHNQMYVAQLRNEAQWVVAIRGSVFDPDSWAFWNDWFVQDNPMTTAPWPYDGTGQSRTTAGLQSGLSELLGMVDPAQGYLMDFLWRILQRNQAPGSVAIVGHSLGGSLTPLLSAYLYERVCKPHAIPASCLAPVTFAAPTSGNAAFATYVEGLFGGYKQRWVNDLDAVPHAWTSAGLDWIMKSYDPAPQIDGLVADFVGAFKRWDDFWEFGYTQPGPEITLDSQLQTNLDWFGEAGYQHSTSTYLELLGAPPVNIAKPSPLPLGPDVRWDADVADLAAAP